MKLRVAACAAAVIVTAALLGPLSGLSAAETAGGAWPAPGPPPITADSPGDISPPITAGPSGGVGPSVGVARQVAPACLVERGGWERCFSSVAAMEMAMQAEERLPHQPDGGPFGALTCSVILFSGAGYTGEALGLTTPFEWLNLANYGFADLTVSFLSSGCGFHLAQGVNGAGYWYPGYTGPGASSPNMGPGWNDTVQSVYIE